MISKRIQELREKCRNGFYHRYRLKGFDFSAIRNAIENMDAASAEHYVLKTMLAQETPVIIKEERLQFTRTTGVIIPDLFPRKIVRDAGCTKSWPMGNSTPNYKVLLDEGLEKRISTIEKELLKYPAGSEQHTYLTGMMHSCREIIDFARR